MKAKVLLLATIMLLLANTEKIYSQPTPQEVAALITRGINLGNTFDCPSEGSWGNGPAKEYYFDDYKSAGFTCIRIPVRWETHTQLKSPFTIDAAYLSRVEQVVDWGLSRGLYIIINAHHEDSTKKYYKLDSIKNKFDSIWVQVSNRFKSKSDKLMFEMINEPLGLTQTEINTLNTRVLAVIRKTNPTRIVIYSGNQWSNSPELMAAAIPNDKYVMGYFHSYDPYPFWETGAGTFTSSDTVAIKTKFDLVKAWSVKNNIQVIISETGASNKCAYNARMFHYATYVSQAMSHGIPYQTWDDGGNFKVYDRNARNWNDIKDVITKSSPESPTALGYKIGSNEIRVLWSKKFSKADSFFIERKNSDGNFVKIASISGDSLAYTDKALESNKTYYYRVISKTSGNVLSYSYPISVLLLANTSIELNNVPAFELYPNPSNDIINIKPITLNSASQITIFDSSGKQVFMNLYNSNSIAIPVKEFSNGTYIVQLTCGGKMYKQSFIKK
jgi:hypothetical protein